MWATLFYVLRSLHGHQQCQKVVETLLKDGDMDIAYQPHCSQPRSTITECSKQKFDIIKMDQRILCWKGKPPIWLTTFLCSKTCDMHFVKSAWWKRLSSFHITSRCMSDIKENCREWLGGAPSSTIQSRHGPIKLPTIWDERLALLERWHNPEVLEQSTARYAWFCREVVRYVQVLLTLCILLMCITGHLLYTCYIVCYRLTFLICSVGFTSPMLFDEKKYPYHLMLQKFVHLGGQNAFFE